MNIILIYLISGLFAALAGVIFGIPSLRIKGFYLAVATLAAQFFFEWLFQSVDWFTNYSSSRTIALTEKTMFGIHIAGPKATAETKYLIALTFLVVFGLAVKNLVRSRIGPLVDGDPRLRHRRRVDRHPAAAHQALGLRRQLVHLRRRGIALRLHHPGELRDGGLSSSWRSRSRSCSW